MGSLRVVVAPEASGAQAQAQAQAHEVFELGAGTVVSLGADDKCDVRLRGGEPTQLLVMRTESGAEAHALPMGTTVYEVSGTGVKRKIPPNTLKRFWPGTQLKLAGLVVSLDGDVHVVGGASSATTTAAASAPASAAAPAMAMAMTMVAEPANELQGPPRTRPVVVGPTEPPAAATTTTATTTTTTTTTTTAPKRQRTTNAGKAKKERSASPAASKRATTTTTPAPAQAPPASGAAAHPEEEEAPPEPDVAAPFPDDGDDKPPPEPEPEAEPEAEPEPEAEAEPEPAQDEDVVALDEDDEVFVREGDAGADVDALEQQRGAPMIFARVRVRTCDKDGVLREPERSFVITEQPCYLGRDRSKAASEEGGGGGRDIGTHYGVCSKEADKNMSRDHLLLVHNDGKGWSVRVKDGTKRPVHVEGTLATPGETYRLRTPKAFIKVGDTRIVVSFAQPP